MKVFNGIYSLIIFIEYFKSHTFKINLLQYHVRKLH